MKRVRRIVAAFLLALPLSFVAMAIPTAAPASADEQLALWTCTHLGGGLFACESDTGHYWLWWMD